MRMNSAAVIGVALIALMIGGSAARAQQAAQPLTEVGQRLETQYAKQLERLRTELTAKIPREELAKGDALDRFLASDSLDSEFAQFVVLLEATPRGLAEFAQQSRERAALVNQLLANADLMRQMLVADGANAKREGRKGYGPAQYGPAVKIYSDIHRASKHAYEDGVLQRLALAIALEHAVPIAQSNPAAETDTPETIDPVKRYVHYEKAYHDGELDSAFPRLSTWELRMVVDGDEPDETLAWGREMLRNYRPDHVYNTNYGWRYVSIVTSDCKYGSQDVKYDRPELQKYQNILMNGGVCGRRAFIGRFILRSFGVPTTARPSRGHAALAHWTPDGWVVNLGGGWGAGWTNTRYHKDVDFLASTQARANSEAFLKVKRAQWAGDVLGEERTYGESDGVPAFWNGVALRTQRAIIDEAKAVTLAALGADLGEANESTVAEKIIASPVTAEDRKITSGANGVISIPAAAYHKPQGNTRDVIAMKSFGGGLQVFLPRFFPEGKTIMRGGTWKNDSDTCTSGTRMLSGGYGKYENWGLRAAVSHHGGATPSTLTLDLGEGVTMELVYIKPGSFVMGGESTTEGRFECVELPKHQVAITKGFYLGKYEVTQAQFQAIMGSNPSRSTKAPDCPVDNVGVDDALSFCGKVAEQTGLDVRLPTEAEWEYASRAGRDTKWFFGDNASQLGEYAWFKDNAGGKSHPVGQKQPNPWGLYDVYGNVNERISDTYARGYYANSPQEDPTGPSQGTSSRFEYQVTAPRSGKYALTAQVVTANYDQRLNLSVNDADSPIVMELPFTVGNWQDAAPVTLELREGENTLRFWRDQPPQYGVAIKGFTLTPHK
ncbi:MAG: SUMF1/EgtB/PvdO family nonheme iron enzyme [Planctomycetales bacterium]|nr:SUMF1/EgtB/PvdO family nonheme iron enzyme [Planctomycetales bacterium]